MSFALLNLNDFSLVNLDSHTVDKTTNEAYHEINNNTLNKSNIKEVTTDITDIQNGNRIKGRDYKLDNHYNAGHESFGLQLQNLGVDDFMGDMGFINLEQQGLQNLNDFGRVNRARTAIVATPE